MLGLHWDSVQRIIDAAVARGLARRTTAGIRRVGLDEKSFLRGQSYVSLMTDLDGRRVLEVLAGRDTQTFVKLWEALPEEQRAKVEAAAMDMGAHHPRPPPVVSDASPVLAPSSSFEIVPICVATSSHPAQLIALPPTSGVLDKIMGNRRLLPFE